MAFQKFKIFLISFLLFAYNILIKSWNLFKFPIYTEDEGTYVSQASALWELGQLSYYTYWYDHAPIGWILISIWQKFLSLTLLDFGNSLNNTRVFMILVSCYILWCLMQILTHFKVSNVVKYSAAIFYIFSPLIVYFQRIIFLDNLMIAFVMTAIVLLLDTSKTMRVIFSAIFLALAVLTKESAVFFVPFFLVYGVKKFYSSNKKMLLTLWATFFGFMVLQYPTFALLKGELLPKSIPLLGNPGQVSLIDAIFFQSNRSENFWSPDSALWYSLRTYWLQFDALLIIAGVVGMLWGLVSSIKSEHKNHSYIWVLGLSYIFYLLRWQAQEWYIIPLLPICIISCALLLDKLRVLIPKNLFYTLLLVIFVVYVPINTYANRELYVKDITHSQIDAVQWARDNITTDGITVIDNYAFLELNDASKAIEYQKYHYFWKVEKDPEIREGLINNDHKNIDYVLMTPAMEDDFAQEEFPFLVSYISKARLVAVIGDIYPIKVYSLNGTTEL